MESKRTESVHIATLPAAIDAICTSYPSNMVYAAAELTVQEFELPLGSEVPTKYDDDAHMGAVSCMATYGDYLFTGSSDGAVKVWERSTWQCLRTLEGHTAKITGLVGCTCLPELPDPYVTVVSCSADSTLRVWHLKREGCAFVHRLPGPALCLASNETKVVCACDGGDMMCFDVEILDAARGIIKTYEYEGLWQSLDTICCLTIATSSQGARNVIAGDAAGLLCAWALETGSHLGVAQCYEGLAALVDIGHGKVAVALNGGTVMLWSTSQGYTSSALHPLTTLQTQLRAMARWEVGDACGYRSSRLVVGCGDGTLHLLHTSRPLSESVDKYRLFHEAVLPEPDDLVDFLIEIFEDLWEREPSTLRVDFCHTGKVAAEWAQRGEDMCATGIEADPDMLTWGRREYNDLLHQDIAMLMNQGLSLHDARREQAIGEGQLRLLQGDLRDQQAHQLCCGVDVVICSGYCWMGLHDRSELTRYFHDVFLSLKPCGLFALDLFGGQDAEESSVEELGPSHYQDPETNELQRFEAQWEQKYDDVTRRAQCAVHFELRDGSKINDAFEFEWSIWRLEEVHASLMQAGFARVQVYLECCDNSDNMTGEYKEIDDLSELQHQTEVFEAQIVAMKKEYVLR